MIFDVGGKSCYGVWREGHGRSKTFFWWIQRHNFGEFFSTYIRKAAIKPFSFWIFLQRLWGFLMEEFFILSTTTTPTSSPLFFWKKKKKTGIEIAHWGDQTWSLTFSIIVLCKNVCVYAITSDIYYIKVIGHQKQTSYRAIEIGGNTFGTILSPNIVA